VAISHADDWKVAAAVLPHSRRTLLYGPPGTGKTTLGFSGDEDPYYIGCHDELSVAEVIGHFVPAGNRFVWLNGPGLAAAVEGMPLVIDEIDLASGAVLSFLRALLNDPGVARFTVPDPALAALPEDELAALISSGEGLKTVEPAEGFRVLATMNGEPEDLDGPLLDRFDAVLRISETNPAAIKALPADLRTAAKRTANTEDIDRRIGLRRWKSFAQLREFVGEDVAGRAAFGDRYGDVVDALRLARPAEMVSEPEPPGAESPEATAIIDAVEGVLAGASEPAEPAPAVFFQKTGKRGRPPKLSCEEHGAITHRSADERPDGVYCNGRGRECGRKIAPAGGYTVRVLRDGKWTAR
jgi:MoxR-like ATPase